MSSNKFKVGDRVRVLSTFAFSLEMNGNVGIIKSPAYASHTWIVDMGKPRRVDEPNETCWWVSEDMLELVSKKGEQMLLWPE